MHFSLVKINPPDVAPAHGFDDVILPVFFALRRLGYSVEILSNRSNPRSRNIVFGSCMAPRRVGRELPPGSIIFNLEQITGANKWSNLDYLTHLRDFSIWDYSPRNIERLEQLGVHGVRHVPLGYVPEMTRINEHYPRDVDVLFYGLINERRHAVIKKLCDAGVHVLATQSAFGNLRDHLLARSKLLLHVHYYTPACLEQARLGYAWANSRTVVSEWREDTEIPEHLAQACAWYAYEDLVDGVRQLLADDALRDRHARQGFAAFSAVPLVETLAALVGRRTHRVGRTAAQGDTKADPAQPHCAYHCAAVREWLVEDSNEPATA